MAGRSPGRPGGASAPDPTSRHVLSWRWVAFLLALVALFAGLRGVAALAEPPQPTAIPTEQVVVVGVAGRTSLTDVDRAVLAGHLDDAQVGSVSVRPRYVGACAAAGWTTLGAGRRAAVGDLCDPQVEAGRVLDWPQREAAAAARRGDARLGTLADAVQGCVAAVGPGAALAAAHPDGTLDDYRTVQQFQDDGLRTRCPTTLVDPGPAADAVVTQLAADPSRTLVVTGVGPAAGSDDPSLQVLYRLGSTSPGWVTSASTRREGIVTLTDLTRTLVDHDRPAGACRAADRGRRSAGRGTGAADRAGRRPAPRGHRRAVRRQPDRLPDPRGVRRPRCSWSSSSACCADAGPCRSSSSPSARCSRSR